MLHKTTVNCPHCDCEYRLERGDEIRTKDCAGCGRELCEECDQFKCDACDERFCVEHRIQWEGDWICVDCALFWAQEMKGKLRRLLEERMEERMTRGIAAMRAWRAAAAASECPLFVEEVA